MPPASFQEMAYSYQQYTGDGAKKGPYTVPSNYISKLHIVVKVDGVLQTSGTDYSWLTASTIEFTTAPDDGSIISIERQTSRGTRLVDYESPSALPEEDLDNDSIQAFYMAQEAIDTAQRGMVLDLSDNKYDADDKVIKSVADPVNDGDAVNKGYAETNYGGAAATQAETARDVTEGYRDETEGFKNDAASSATAAATSETNAATYAASAANTLASALWRDVVHLTSADSPRAITSSDNGKLLVCDTSGGAIVINLDDIADLSEPFNVSVKWEAGTNSPTINRAGTDTIDGETSYTFPGKAAAMFIADADTSPDQWEVIFISDQAPLTFSTLPQRMRTAVRLSLYNMTR